MASPNGDNAYCREFGIEPPRLPAFVDKRNVPLLRLLILALLERGQPMTLSEIAERLDALGVLTPTGDLALSLQKAWHGLPPVVREPDGCLGLDVYDIRLKFVLIDLGLLPLPTIAPPLDVAAALNRTGPLSREEVAAALKTRSRAQLSHVRAAAAVLDAAAGGHPMTLDEINRQLAGLGAETLLSQKSIDFGVRPRPFVLVVDGSGRLNLSHDPTLLESMRSAIRGLAAPVLRRWERQRLGEEARQRFHRELAQDRKEAEALRRAVVHACIVDGVPAAATVIDVNAHTLETVTSRQLAELPRRLAGFDVIAGLDVRALLASLHVEAGARRLVDLARHPRTLRLNRTGSTLKLTTARLLGWSTGLGRAAPDARRLIRLARAGVTGKLVRRLESEAKALRAFYRYGVLHCALRVHWGFLDQLVNVNWGEPGDRYIGGVFHDALEQHRPVDVVLRSAPGWEDPWSRAWRADVVACEPGHVTLTDGVMSQSLWLGEVQEVRLADPVRPSVQPASPSAGAGTQAGILRQCINWLISEMGYELVEGGCWQSPEIEDDLGVPKDAEAMAVVTPETFRGVVSFGDFQRRVREVIERARQEASRRRGRRATGGDQHAN